MIKTIPVLRPGVPVLCHRCGKQHPLEICDVAQECLVLAVRCDKRVIAGRFGRQLVVPAGRVK